MRQGMPKGRAALWLCGWKWTCPEARASQ